ncbi:hypothetical protein [Sphingomonas sp.]|uniref:hypothetical protein n=1 Tax=Sphingomonas sp. TaxID=28214 RepID=UPI000DB50C41|nr:hypothetical protein [Sphingomonas sp.]PZU06735.1 MAG: hypothetical protein DI605_18080 [Sphingomonas sp.]
MNESQPVARPIDRPQGYLVEIDGQPNYVSFDDMGDRIILRGRARLLAVFYATEQVTRLLPSVRCRAAVQRV